MKFGIGYILSITTLAAISVATYKAGGISGLGILTALGLPLISSLVIGAFGRIHMDKRFSIVLALIGALIAIYCSYMFLAWGFRGVLFALIASLGLIASFWLPQIFLILLYNDANETRIIRKRRRQKLPAKLELPPADQTRNEGVGGSEE